MKISRRNLLLSGAATAAVGTRALAQSALVNRPEYLVVLLAEGGWDVTFVFDDKLSSNTIEGPEVDQDPGDPDDLEGRETYGGLTIVGNPVKRPMVSDFFARWHSQTCIVNGLWMGSIAHDPCRFRILTGTQFGTSPDLASIIGFENGGDLPLGTVDLSGWSLNGPLAASAGRVGANSQIRPLIDPSTTFTPTPAIGRPYPLYAPTDPGRNDAELYVKARAKALQERFGGTPRNDQRLDDLLSSIDRAQRFRTEGRTIIDDLTLGARASLATQTRMAASLLADGLCRTVTVDSRKDWDTHDANFLQHGHFDALFMGLGLLMDALADAGIQDRTLVAVVSEMTRTPAINAAAGKDHWGHTSALLVGPSVRGSTQIGGTDDKLESLPVDYATGEVAQSGSFNKYENLSAGTARVVRRGPATVAAGCRAVSRVPCLSTGPSCSSCCSSRAGRR